MIVQIPTREGDAIASGMILSEAITSREQHGEFHSAHEGMGVLQEEMYELWDAVRENDVKAVILEATQVAAMALRLIVMTRQRQREQTYGPA